MIETTKNKYLLFVIQVLADKGAPDSWLEACKFKPWQDTKLHPWEISTFLPEVNTLYEINCNILCTCNSMTIMDLTFCTKDFIELLGDIYISSLFMISVTPFNTEDNTLLFMKLAAIYSLLTSLKFNG